MKNPITIAEDLYFESHYDAATLTLILVSKILEPIGLDYRDILVELRPAIISV